MDLNVLTLIRPGDTLEIHYVNKSNDDVFLETIVYDVISDEELLIHNPLKEGRLFMIPMGIHVNMFVKRSDMGVVIFEATLIARKKMGSVYTISCQGLCKFQKQQRRGFFRVNVFDDMDMYFMIDQIHGPIKHYIFDPDAVEEEQINMKVTILDISGGGVGVKSSIPLPEGTYVYGVFNFLDQPIEIYGVVVRSFESVRFENTYEIGIAFENLPREVVRKIASFVFSRQQKVRRKERT